VTLRYEVDCVFDIDPDWTAEAIEAQAVEEGIEVGHKLAESLDGWTLCDSSPLDVYVLEEREP
jgi:hypothetical protein